MRIPISDKLHIEQFSGSAIEAADHLGKNTINGSYMDRPYVTQRPSINVKTDASEQGAGARGRGVYYWAAEDANYIVNAASVYKADYGTTCTLGTGAAFTTGTERVYFCELGDYLIIIDQENDKGYYIDRGVSSTVYNQISNAASGTDDNFPTTVAAGCVSLDGYLFVMDHSGNIYNSHLNDPTKFRATDFIESSREADSGIYIDKHHDHIVAFGSTTIEFFFNAGNATNSPLERRKDIFYNYGLVSGESAWREADTIYGIGIYPSAALYPYKLENFQLFPIANPTVESFITQAHVVDGSNIVGNGFSTGGNTFYCVTFYRIQSSVVAPDISLVMDGKGWNEWETTVGGLTDFPLIGWTIRTGSAVVSGEGIMTNGDIVTINDDFIPQDSRLASDFYETGVVAAGYVTSVTGDTVNIEMKARSGPLDFGTNSRKFMFDLELVGDLTQASQDATVKWADGNSINFNVGRTVDTSTNQKIARLGSFKRRNLEFNLTGAEQVRLEGFDCEITKGDD